MILHINSDALHGLISHRDHSNVNHISSSILLNMCTKPLLPQSKAQRHYTSLQYKFGESDRTSYWASVHWKRKVSRKRLHLSHVSGVMWIRDVLTMGAVKAGECKALPVGAFVEGELHLSWMQFFPSPFMPFIPYSYCFFFKKLIRGHCPGVVTSSGSVTHKYFHRNEKAGS
jgi:hypothetical protein